MVSMVSVDMSVGNISTEVGRRVIVSIEAIVGVGERVGTSDVTVCSIKGNGTAVGIKLADITHKYKLFYEQTS